mmetsp:Transcript_44223/g.88834  ORF Transcript_44223/g.88834 Transcript_44223/m.88834 type:complete len:312 (-) Transcript_44223:713-1648(-)
MYPAMLARLALRHVQFAIVGGVDQWVREDTANDFGKLLVECGSSSTSVALLLREAAAELAQRIPTDKAHAIITARLEPLVEAITAGKRKAKAEAGPSLASATQEDRERNWEQLPLKEIWADPNFKDLPEYLEEIRSEQEPLSPAEAAFHPYDNPREWRKYAEETAWENARGQALPIEAIFANVFNHLPGQSSKPWLRAAGIIDDEFNLVTKVNTSRVPASDFGPGYQKNPEWPGPSWEREGEEEEEGLSMREESEIEAEDTEIEDSEFEDSEIEDSAFEDSETEESVADDSETPTPTEEDDFTGDESESLP